MTNVLVTVSRGEIKNVDGFIKAFRSVGHNMKVLAISGYEFLTSDDKELSIEFGKRVRDELGMSKATLSNLRTAGYLYKLNDNFLPFSYTNVVAFKKVVKKLEDSDLLNEANINKTLIDIARFADSQQPEEVTNCAEFLASLSQKNLESIITKFLKAVDTEEVTEEETEEETDVEMTIPDGVDEVEDTEDTEDYDDPRITMYKDDIVNTLNILAGISTDMTKNDIITEITKAVELLGNAYDRTQDN